MKKKEKPEIEKKSRKEAKEAQAKKERKEKPAAKKIAKEKNGAKEPKSVQKKSSGPFEWVEFKPKEIEEVIMNLANTGKTPSEIGMILRDQYGIPKVKKIIGKKMGQFLEENKLLPEVPHDLLTLIKKSVIVERHLKENKKDMTAKRGLQLTVSKIRKLVKYYQQVGKLPKEWKYTSERAALLVK